MSEPNNESVAGHPFFCSWSGGKDSCLALHRAIREGGSPKRLFTMMREDGRASRSHGLPRYLLEEQARQIGIPIDFRSASWEAYETVFSEMLGEFQTDGIETGVFGDIDIEDHRDWCRRVCGARGMRARHPLWKHPRRKLLEEFIRLGFKATIVVTKADTLGSEWLGRMIDENAVSELEKLGVDPSGESGEYHTLVTDGPIFPSPIEMHFREHVLHDGYWFLGISGMTDDDRNIGATPDAAGYSPAAQ